MEKGGEKMKGLVMAARFSLGCNEAALFPERGQALLRFLENPQDITTIKQAEETLEQFKILFPYLSLIGRINGLEPFSQEVVEAYFIGNKLLRNVPIVETRRVVNQIYSQEVSLVPDFVPHHNWHLLTVLPQTQGMSIPLSLFNFCMVKLGKIQAIHQDKVTVRAWKLSVTKGKLNIGWIDESIPRDTILIDELELGDKVAIHWRYICEKLSSKQAQHLEEYTHRVLGYAKIRGE